MIHTGVVSYTDIISNLPLVLSSLDRGTTSLARWSIEPRHKSNRFAGEGEDDESEEGRNVNLTGNGAGGRLEAGEEH